MSSLKGKVIVITGASSGIGEATARILAEGGATIMLGARRVENLKNITTDLQDKGYLADYKELDVTSREQMDQFIKDVSHTYGKVDVIINNAGIMPLSMLEELKVEEWDRMIDVNIRGVLYGIAAGLPIMKEQGYGHFINLCSIGGYAVSPTAAVYCATKFAVRAISEGLRIEAGESIRVTNVSPGVTESELADHISDETARQTMKEFRKDAIPATAIAEAIKFAITQPSSVDVNELIIRPTASAH